MKRMYIEDLPTKMSSGRHIPKNQTNINKRKELQKNFLDDTLEEEFFGFDISLEQIFNSDNDSNYEFLGFEQSLRHIFNYDDDMNETFLGFDLSLGHIFNSEHDLDTEFLGFL